MKLRRSVRCICVAIVIAIGLLANESTARLIIEDPIIGNFSLETSQYYWREDDLNSVFDDVTATLTDSSATDVQGKIIYFPKGNYLTFVATVKDFQDRGAVAVLYASSALVPGQNGCGLTANQPSGVITIPIAEINNKQFQPILNAMLNGTVLTATLTSEGSPWIRAVVNAGVIVAFRAILPAVAVALIIYAIYKMVLFIRHQGHQFNVPQVSLALEIIANLLRLIYLPVDPFGCFGVYGQAFSFVTTISFPYEVATFILITFYWHEALTDASVKVYPFLSKFKVFFFVFIIAFIISLQLVTILGYFLNFSVTTPLIIIYLIVSVAFLIFYIITVVKVSKQVKQANNMRQGRKMKLRTINKKIIINGTTRVVSLIPVIIYIAPEISSVPIPHVTASAFIYALFMLDSWARIYLFKAPSGKNSSTSNRSVNSGHSMRSGTTTTVANPTINTPRDGSTNDSDV
jgi:hypothetical protein